MYPIRQLNDKSLKESIEVLLLGRFGEVGGVFGPIERQINLDTTLRHPIEQIRERASSTSIHKKI